MQQVALAFSLSGRHLMALGDDEAHRFAVWDWGEGTPPPPFLY